MTAPNLKPIVNSYINLVTLFLCCVGMVTFTVEEEIVMSLQVLAF